MKRLSLAFMVVLFSVLALVSASTTALAAPAIKVPFSATLQDIVTLGVERWWTDEEGTMHARGMVVTANITGDINGQVNITVNMNMDTSGYGDEQVKGVITVGSEEAYRMTADITIEAGVISSSNFVIHGMGSYKGIHITGTITPIDPTHVLLTGTKLTTKP